MCRLDVRMESWGFMPAMERIVFARVSNPLAARFDGAANVILLKTTF